MKKVVLLLCLLVLVLNLCACSARSQNPGIADDEIMTYTPLDPKKTQLTISITGSLDRTRMITKFQEDNPDIQITILDITGGNNDYAPMYDWLEHGYLPDVMFLTNGTWWLNDTYFEDLSTNPVTSRYKIASLNEVVQNGRIYFLPGPASVIGMLYNKDMFKKYGWEVPKTVDEMAALCAQITKDTNGTVTPWNMNAKYPAVFETPIQAACYEAVLRGTENQVWVSDLMAGKATFQGHYEPFFEVGQKLIDAGILKESDFTYSATTRLKEFKDGHIAMLNHNTSEIRDTDFEIGYFPFVGEHEGEDYLRMGTSFYMGVTKKENSEKVKDAIARFIDYISTPEAHKMMVGDAMMISSLKDLTLSNGAEYSELTDAIENGRYFPYYDFVGGKDDKSLNISNIASDLLLKMVKGNLTAEEATKQLDEARSTFSGAGKANALATVSENFTILETSEFFADMYRQKTGSDMALVLNNVIFRGNVMKFLSGEVTDKMVVVFKPRSNDNGSTLVKAVMTGQQILDALDHPMGKDGAVANCTYAYSGLKCTVAPWNEQGSRMLKVQLSDGTELDPAKKYTVSFWAGTVSDEYITEIVETYEDTFEELLTAQLLADGTISPAKDGRTTLKWN